MVRDRRTGMDRGCRTRGRTYAGRQEWGEERARMLDAASGDEMSLGGASGERCGGHRFPRLRASQRLKG